MNKSAVQTHRVLRTPSVSTGGGVEMCNLVYGMTGNTGLGRIIACYFKEHNLILGPVTDLSWFQGGRQAGKERVWKQ